MLLPDNHYGCGRVASLRVRVHGVVLGIIWVPLRHSSAHGSPRDCRISAVVPGPGAVAGRGFRGCILGHNACVPPLADDARDDAHGSNEYGKHHHKHYHHHLFVSRTYCRPLFLAVCAVESIGALAGVGLVVQELASTIVQTGGRLARVGIWGEKELNVGTLVFILK